jgi:opacity protein-like surface antigen
MQMKKLMLAVIAVAVMSTASFAGWGAAAKLGVAENDPKTMKNAHDAVGGDFDKGYGVFSLEGLYEMPFDAADEANKVGVKLGLDIYGENELKATGVKLKEDTYAFPLTVYYKRDNGVKNVSFWAGPGLTFLRTETEQTVLGVSDDVNKNKVFFHIAGGAEYRFTELFALGLDLRYNFGAKVKKDGAVLSDRSGFGGAVAARFYF